MFLFCEFEAFANAFPPSLGFCEDLEQLLCKCIMFLKLKFKLKNKVHNMKYLKTIQNHNYLVLFQVKVKSYKIQKIKCSCEQREHIVVKI